MKIINIVIIIVIVIVITIIIFIIILKVIVIVILKIIISTTIMGLYAMDTNEYLDLKWTVTAVDATPTRSSKVFSSPKKWKFKTNLLQTIHHGVSK